MGRRLADNLGDGTSDWPALPALMLITAKLGPPVDIGSLKDGRRRCVPILGGTVEGRHRGIVLPGGSDWQTIAGDGTLDIQARYALELEEGIVEVTSNGLRSGAPAVLARLAAGEIVPADQYYFRTAMRFGTASTALAELNSILAVAVGKRLPGSVRLAVYRVP